MVRDKLGRFIKGYHYNPQTEFKKGQNLREKHPQWKGGRYKNFQGYILFLKPNHPFANKQGYIYEHRLVAEKKLGRYLLPNEVTHHLNGIKDDNRPENIVICKSDKEHFSNHRKYKRFTYKNKPFPIKLGEKIVITCNNKNSTYETTICKECNKLFWKDIYKSTKFCSLKCFGKKHPNYKSINIQEVLYKHKILKEPIIQIAKNYNIAFSTLYRKIRRYAS